MRFLADENVSRLVLDRLRADGHDVVSIAETDPGASDQDVLQLANSAMIILITEDQDFGELVIRHRLPVLGVPLLELDRLSNEAEAERVASVVAQHADRFAGSLVVVEPARTRVRPLPKATPP